MMDEDFLRLGVGGKLRRLREDKGRSIDDVARTGGIDPEQLERYEADQAVPAIGELLKIAGALGVSIGHFFQTAIPEKRIEVVRSDQRWNVHPKNEAAITGNYRYQALSHGLTDKLMSPFLVEVPPTGDQTLPSSQHEGEEFLFVLAGRLEVTVGDEVHVLEPGDAMYYDSRLEHTLRAAEGVPARVLACVAQPRPAAPNESLGRTRD